MGPVTVSATLPILLIVATGLIIGTGVLAGFYVCLAGALDAPTKGDQT